MTVPGGPPIAASGAGADTGAEAGTVAGVEPHPLDPSPRWAALRWAPIVAAAAATAALTWAGPGWVGRLGAPPVAWMWWPAVPASALTHLSSAHLATNALAWWVTLTAAQRGGLEATTVPRVFCAGWVAGVAAHVALGGGGHLHGASAGICALAVWVAARGGGRWRAAAAAVAAAALLPGTGTSTVAHLAGVAAGTVAALSVRTSRP